MCSVQATVIVLKLYLNTQRRFSVRDLRGSITIVRSGSAYHGQSSVSTHTRILMPCARAVISVRFRNLPCRADRVGPSETRRVNTTARVRRLVAGLKIDFVRPRTYLTPRRTIVVGAEFEPERVGPSKRSIYVGPCRFWTFSGLSGCHTERRR